MTTSAFVTLAVSVITVGGIIGGVFLGGFVLGKRQAPDLPATSVLSTGPSLGGQLPGLSDLGDSTLNLEALRSSLGQGGGGGGAFGFGGGLGAGLGGGLFGTIESIGDGTVALATPQGQVEFTLGEDTVIQGIAELEPADLTVGSMLTVVGRPDVGGTVTATQVFVLPEGMGGAGMFGRQWGGFSAFDSADTDDAAEQDSE